MMICTIRSRRSLPAISREQALRAAGAVGFTPGPFPGITISARYELMSFENPEVWAGTLKMKGLDSHTQGFVDIPVWVVSYEGLAIPPSGPPPPEGSTPTPRGVNRELNVVISAENGEYLGGFTYR